MGCSYVNLRNMACSWGVIEASTLQNMSASRDPSSMPRPYSVWRRRRAGHKGRRTADTADTADTAVMPRDVGMVACVGEVWWGEVREQERGHGVWRVRGEVRGDGTGEGPGAHIQLRTDVNGGLATNHGLQLIASKQPQSNKGYHTSHALNNGLYGLRRLLRGRQTDRGRHSSTKPTASPPNCVRPQTVFAWLHRYVL
jgi:hypothetical protein